MKYIFIIAAFNAFFFTLLIWQKKTRAGHDNLLMAWLVYLGFYTFTYAFFADKIFINYPLIAASFISFLMLHGPFLYLYLKMLVSDSEKTSKNILLHLFPFLMFNLYLLIIALTPGVDGGITFDHVHSGDRMPFLFSLFLILTVLSGPFYILLSIKLFKKLDINIFNNFSNEGEINLNWLRKLVYTFGIIWSFLMIVAVVHHVFQYFSLSFCTDGLFLALSVFIILIGYHGLKQREIFVKESENEFVTIKKAKKYAGTGLKDEDLIKYSSMVQSYMSSKKPYLNPSLNLPQLSEALEIPSHHLSQTINQHIGSNFFDFVNQYRVEEVKQKIRDSKYDQYSILGIALESGFNSKSAFNRIFKKITGTTPTQYRKQASPTTAN